MTENPDFDSIRERQLAHQQRVRDIASQGREEDRTYRAELAAVMQKHTELLSAILYELKEANSPQHWGK